MVAAEASAITELAQRFSRDFSLVDEGVHVSDLRLGKDAAQRTAGLAEREYEGVVTEVRHG
jgi:hypothetical protein